MQVLAICVLTYCLIAEGEAKRCAPATEPDTVIQIERSITFADTADLGPAWTTPEYRACQRIAAETMPPVNHRRTDLFVEHLRGKQSR